MNRLSETPASPPLSGWAVTSLVLGLLSVFLLLNVVTGIPALLLGHRSLRSINESDDRLRGRSCAIMGMVLGGFGILGGVVGLAWIGLTQLQNTAHKISCKDNLRRLGDALHEYEMQTRHFPRGTVPNDRLPPGERLSWNVTVLPYLLPDYPQTSGAPPQKSLFNQFDKESGWNAPANRKAVETPVRFLLCPALPGGRSHHGPALTTYPGMAGLGSNAAELPRERDGVLTQHIGIFGYDREVTPEDLTRGLSFTLLLAETAHANGPWAAGGPSTVRGLDLEDRPYLGNGRQFGGLHVRGLNVLMADGSVPFLNENLSTKQWETMATAADPP